MLQLSRHAVDKLATCGIQGRSLWTMDLSQHLTTQLKSMERLVDAETGAILFRHPTLRGIPDLVVEGDGYTLEFIGPTLLCLDIDDPTGMARLLADPVKAQLPVGV
jgi:hypothetical protein